MSTGLMSLPSNPNTALSSDLSNLMFSGSFLPRLQFFSNAAEDVKSGDVSMNVYGLVSGEEVTELGQEVDVVPFGIRAKAMDIRTPGVVLNYHNHNSPEFKNVFKLSGEKDAAGQKIKCMAGVEFLIWVPQEEKFCTFFCYNVSSKREAPKIQSLINEVCTLKSKYVKRPTNSFTAIVCVKSSTPPESLPTQEDLNAEIEKFMNAKDSAQQTVTAAEAATQDRPQ